MKIVIIIVAILLLILLRLWMLRAKRAPKDFYGLGGWHYAHRGLHSGDAPENSLTALARAVQHHYGAEIDVHLTKDRKLVVFHDRTLLRMTGDERIVEECTYDELQQLRLQQTQEKIPLLQDVLALFEGRTPLLIEIKTRGNFAELTDRVCELLTNYPKLKFALQSFDPRVLHWLKKHRPNVIRGQISCNFMRSSKRPILPAALLMGNLATNFWTVPHFIGYRFSDRRSLALRLCKRIWGVQEVNWTLRSAQEAESSLADGVPIIFEDFLP